MKKTLFAAAAAVMMLAAAGAADEKALSSAQEIARYESGGELARDPAEKPVDAPKDMKLILCIGQSNMAGRAKPTEEDRAVVPRAYKLNRDMKWVAAKSPYHFDKKVAAVGPVDDFVKLYLKDHPGESVGVVPCAVGGSPLVSWTPGEKGRRGANLRVALERARAAKANGSFIAVLWHQGETDAAKATAEQLAEYYPRDFKAMVEAVRGEIGDVPVIAGEIGRWMRRDGDNAAKINPTINSLTNTVPNCAVVSSEGLKNQDAHHFDREGQRALAARYYEEFRKCAAVALHGGDMHKLVDSIYDALTPEERVAQICATSAGNLAGSDGKFSAAKARSRIPHGIGHVCQFACNRTDEPEALAQFVRDVQAFCLNETRAGIPAICHEEVISGLAARTATTYPQQIAVASSWDAPLLERKCRETSEAMRAVGATFALSPMADVIVNSNWTRLEEGYGESGYLSAVMGTAFVHGLQASGHAAACTKHFLGYGTIGGGEQRGWRDIFEEVVYPHEAMINVGGAAAVMTSYDQFKGEQAVSSPALIQGILRGYIGFDGTVVSDYSAVEWGMRGEKDEAAKRRLMKERAAAAIKVGNDVDLPQGAAYSLALECVRDGLVTEKELEKAVKNALLLKARLGLLGTPAERASAANPPRTDKIELDRPEWRATALDLAREGVVLLKNDGVLPIGEKTRRIALVGPNANSAWAMLGDYTYQCMQAFWRRNPREWDKPHIVTLKEGMERVFGAERIAYARGCAWSNPGDTGVSAGGDPRTEALSLKLVDSADPTDFASAVKSAAECDVIVCAMGENFTLCGESRQRASIRLAGDQEKLVEAMIATGKPVVLVLFGGRNQVISPFVDRCAAVLQAWYPGEEGGRAVAEILAGTVNPSGRLPMTYPKTESREPLTFGDGSDTPERVQWPFGYGLSYTKFAYGDAELTSGAATRIGGVGDCVKAAVTVKNVGGMAGAEVVQLYITAKDEPVRLRGFARVALKPGETKRVEFSVPLELFARWRGDNNGAWSVEPGEYEIRLGSDAWDKSRVLAVRLEGAPLSFPRRTLFFSAAK